MLQHVSIVQRDITTMKVDCIVNAANQAMLGGGGVDGAIHRVAGPDLLAACEQVEPVGGVRCPTGEARVTVAGNLQAQFVIHTVGPRYYHDENPASLLESAYRNSLECVLERHCHSVAFPAISCGVYGYPLEEAADIAFSVCAEKPFRSLQIFFCLFGDEIFAIWQQVYSRRSS